MVRAEYRLAGDDRMKETYLRSSERNQSRLARHIWIVDRYIGHKAVSER